MSREHQQMRVRLPPELRDGLEQMAKKNGRSMNAEIVYRLQRTFDEDAWSTDGIQVKPQASSNPPRTYKKKLKSSLQTAIPEEVIQDLVAQLKEAWAKHEQSKDE